MAVKAVEAVESRCTPLDALPGLEVGRSSEYPLKSAGVEHFRQYQYPFSRCLILK